MSKQKLTLTVGITTNYGDTSLVKAIQSLRESKNIEDFQIIVVADRHPIKPSIKKRLQELEVTLFENKVGAGQMPKKNQIIQLCKSDILLLTNDDVFFDQYALSEILERFARNKKTTLISIRNQPVEAETLLEDIISVGTRVANRVARLWKKGDNYLACIGRCEAIRVNFLKEKLAPLPSEVATSDAYLYFANKRNGGCFEYLPHVAVYFKNPQNFKEHSRKSSRFQYSRLEMSRYFKNLKKEYEVPRHVNLRAIVEELLASPVKTVLYLLTFVYSRVSRLKSEQVLNANWEVDLSTKKI